MNNQPPRDCPLFSAYLRAKALTSSYPRELLVIQYIPSREIRKDLGKLSTPVSNSEDTVAETIATTKCQERVQVMTILISLHYIILILP